MSQIQKSDNNIGKSICRFVQSVLNGNKMQNFHKTATTNNNEVERKARTANTAKWSKTNCKVSSLLLAIRSECANLPREMSSRRDYTKYNCIIIAVLINERRGGEKAREHTPVHALGLWYIMYVGAHTALGIIIILVLAIWESAPDAAAALIIN